MKTDLRRINEVLFFCGLVLLFLHYARILMIPLVSALLLSMLMAPLCNRLDKGGWKRGLSCTLCIFILLIVFSGILAVIMAQLSSFLQSLPLFQQKMEAAVLFFRQQLEQRFNILIEQPAEQIKKETQELYQLFREHLSAVLQHSLRLLAGMIVTLFFTFLMLFHKEKYAAFFLRYSPGESVEEKKETLDTINRVSQQYIAGRAVSIVYFFVAYLLTLLLLGVENALLLAAVGALFNIIPYLGPVLAAVIPTISAITTEAHWQTGAWVLLCFCLIQAIDNYYVTPFYLGEAVNLSALATFIGIIAGGLLWGIAGMILIIPMISILKIIFDRLPALQPFGTLIGDEGKKSTGWFVKILHRIFPSAYKKENSPFPPRTSNR